MKQTLLILVMVLIPMTATPYQKGVALGLFYKEPYYDYSGHLREIKAVGGQSVSLVVSWYQKNVTASEIYSKTVRQGDFQTFPDERLRQTIRQAHAAGLKVFLFPILRLEHREPKQWRGTLKPADKERWFENYRRFILHYAKLASEGKVELFSVGSELCSLEGEQTFWLKLIGEVRSRYSGKLIYSANWDHYEPVKFWSALDYLGLTGYYELSAVKNPTLAGLVGRWKEIQRSLENWQKKQGKKIIFTEIGYPSIDGTSIYPWDYTRTDAIDVEEQALCYEAFFQAWHNYPTFGGVYFWNWYGAGGLQDPNYTPKGKPAEKILKKWYGSSSSPSWPLVSSPPVRPGTTSLKPSSARPPQS
ncbi:MAG: hypothetical protein HYS22_04475 [Deltaproteobacteria bacterium]|nr:hypothetical protein [Deltaproteobacteria bacterium]